MKGIDRLVDFAYGNHPKRTQLKPMAKDLIQKLRDGPVEIREVCKQIGLDYENTADRKKFYIVTKPLREIGALHTTKVGGKTRIYTSYEGFKMWLDNVRKSGEYWFGSKS